MSPTTIVDRTFYILRMLRNSPAPSVNGWPATVLKLNAMPDALHTTVDEILSGKWWRKSYAGWKDVVALAAALEALTEKRAHWEASKYIYGEAKKANDNLHNGMWMREVKSAKDQGKDPLPELKDVPRNDRHAEAKWKENHMFFTSANLSLGILESIKECMTSGQKPNSAAALLRGVPLPPGVSSVEDEKQAQREKRAREVAEPDDFDMLGDPVTEEDPPGSGPVNEGKEAMDVATACQRDGEGEEAPMPKERFEQLSLVRGFNDVNGATYEEYVDNWSAGQPAAGLSSVVVNIGKDENGRTKLSIPGRLVMVPDAAGNMSIMMKNGADGDDAGSETGEEEDPPSPVLEVFPRQEAEARGSPASEVEDQNGGAMERDSDDDEPPTEAELQKMKWQRTRDEANGWLERKEELIGMRSTHGGANWAGQTRKNIDVHKVIAGPHEGLVGKFEEKRSGDGDYIRVLVGPREGDEVLVKCEDLQWYDDYLEQNARYVRDELAEWREKKCLENQESERENKRARLDGLKKSAVAAVRAYGDALHGIEYAGKQKHKNVTWAVMEVAGLLVTD